LGGGVDVAVNRLDGSVDVLVRGVVFVLVVFVLVEFLEWNGRSNGFVVVLVVVLVGNHDEWSVVVVGVCVVGLLGEVVGAVFVGVCFLGFELGGHC